MSINSISGSPVQSVASTNAAKSKTGTGAGFTVNRLMTQADAIGGGATVRYRSADTVSLSLAARSARVNSGADDILTEEMKGAIVPAWYASYYPLAPRVGMTATEMDRLTEKVDRLTPGEKSQYYQGIHNHFREMMQENNLPSGSPSYKALIESQESSERLRVDFERRLAADSVLSALLKKMGGTLSSSSSANPAV